MAKQEFLDNIRIARNLFFHPRVETDNPQLDPRNVARMIARAAIWLTPNSVKGFNAADFRELGPQRQQDLQAAVREFLEVAEQIPANEPATAEQLSRAQGAFARILQIVEPYLPTPHEGEQIEEALRSVPFPPWIVNWDYELGTDQDGEPMVSVYLFADESSAPRHEFGRVASRLNSKIAEALAAAGSNRWPYIRMRTAVEHKSA